MLYKIENMHCTWQWWMVGSWTATSQRKKNNFTCCKSSKLITLFLVRRFKGEGGGAGAAGVGI